MSTTTLYSDNASGTMSDAMKAVGLAEVAAAWLDHLQRPSGPITLSDCGAYYRIDLPSALGDDEIAAVRHPFRCGRGERLIAAKHLKMAEEAGEHPPEGYNYEAMRQQRDTYLARLEKLSPADRRRFRENPTASEFGGITPPDPDLGLYVCINHFKVADGYNALCDRWLGERDLDRFRSHLALMLTTFSQHPNTPPARADTVTALQITNPASGKGNNATKAAGLSIGSVPSFWLFEYLKFVGFFTIATPMLVRASKDRKTYILHPVRAELSALRGVMGSFRETFFRSSAIKLDILAALRFSQSLLQHISRALTASQTSEPSVNPFGIAPRITDIAQGFDIGFYKDMGSAYATMNLATINLPTWLAPVATSQVAESAQSFLAEHERVIRGIATTKGEEASEEIELLSRYRDFLSGHDTARFFDFAAPYGPYLLAKRHRNQWATQLSTYGMEELVNQAIQPRDFLPIISAPGFQAIASAIRSATVRAQRQATRGSGYPFEVRYGLGQELLRSAPNMDDFLATLSTFIQSYNAENARIAERIAKGSLPNIPQNRRPFIRTEHIEELVALADRYRNPELICKMLVAYGYALDARAQPGETEPQPGEEPPDDTDELGA